MKIITVTNQKGGVGKTTTASSLFAGLSMMGKKTLAIDLDPQCNLSYCYKADTSKPSIKNVFKGEIKLSEAIQQTSTGDFIQSDKSLNNIMQELNAIDQVYKLSKVLKEVSDKYDYVIIDTPPALSPLTINALVASTSVIIPVQADSFSMQGAEALAETIQGIRDVNKDLEISGVLLVRYKGRAGLAQHMNEQFIKFANMFETKVFETKIRDAIAVQESQLARQSIFEYNPKSNVALDYANFIKELING
ncbi:MAG: ParA family protein [Treponema sp.]|nr:ParA family protein [Treponema sp.]